MRQGSGKVLKECKLIVSHGCEQNRLKRLIKLDLFNFILLCSIGGALNIMVSLEVHLVQHFSAEH